MFRKKTSASGDIGELPQTPEADDSMEVVEDDEEPVVNLGTSSAGLPLNEIHSRSTKLLADALASGEEVIGRLVGINKSQALVLTDRRVFIIKVGWRSGQTLGGKVSSFEYRNINSVEVRASMLTGVFEIAAGGVQGKQAGYYGKKKESAWQLPNTVPIAKKQMKDFQLAAQAIRERSTVAQHPMATDPKTAQADVVGQIKQLAQLRDAGVLSEAEFAAKKTEMLTRL